MGVGLTLPGMRVMISEPEKTKKAGEFGGDKLMPLLEERSLFKERIRLLESKREEVSKEVFVRVQQDYSAKLDNLNSEINRHANTLEATRRDYHELLDQLRQAVAHGRRSLEYENVEEEKKNKIESYRKKIKTYNVNMQRLDGVLSQIGTE